MDLSSLTRNLSPAHGVVKSRTRLSNFTLTFHFHALEKEMATHSSVLAWRIPGDCLHLKGFTVSSSQEEKSFIQDGIRSTAVLCVLRCSSRVRLFVTL